MALHLLHRVNTDVVINETFLGWCIIQGEKKKERKRTTEMVIYATNRNIALSTYVNKIKAYMDIRHFSK